MQSPLAAEPIVYDILMMQHGNHRHSMVGTKGIPVSLICSYLSPHHIKSSDKWLTIGEKYSNKLNKYLPAKIND